MQTSHHDKAKRWFYLGATVYYLNAEALKRNIAKEESTCDNHGKFLWSKHPDAPETDGEDRKAYMFPGKSSYRCHRVAMAKTIVLNWYLKDNKNRPFANIMFRHSKP